MYCVSFPANATIQALKGRNIIARGNALREQRRKRPFPQKQHKIIVPKPLSRPYSVIYYAMKIKQLPILLLIVCSALPVWGQLTADELAQAVQQSACDQVAAELDKTPLPTTDMKFHAAICFYRNGDPERAQNLFEAVRLTPGPRQHFATFWAAKCLIATGHDSTAVALLQTIPDGILNLKMLSQTEFNRLASDNHDFQQLKKSVMPGFNCWTGMLAAIAVSGLLIGLILFLGKSRFTAGEKRLAVVMLAFGLILLSYVLMWTKYTFVFPYLQHWWQFLTFLIGPSLYFYLKDIFKEDYTFRGAAVHYVVPVLSGLFTIPQFLTVFGIQTGIAQDFFTIASSNVLMTGHLLFYTILIHQMTQNEWQVDDNIRIWTRLVSRGMMLYTGAFISYFVLANCSFFNPEWDYAVSFMMAVGILVVAYMGLLQKRVFNSEPIGRFLTVRKYQSSNLTPGAGESIKKRMERLLTEQQVFKENELRLDDLAAYLNTSRHQLSQVINEYYGMNFFELINKYRVEYVRQLLTDPAYSQYTIIQIAYEAGFNNKASFNRYFKKEYGLTPSAFRLTV